MSYDLSIFITARSEYFPDPRNYPTLSPLKPDGSFDTTHFIDLLYETVTNVLTNTGPTTELIVVLDGYQPPRALPADSRLTVVHHSKSIGQRAACNEAVRLSRAKYVCKLDAHCAIDKDFDVKMTAVCEYDVTLIPAQYNLHAFDWKCKKCGHRWYQTAKGPCSKCKSQHTKLVTVWQPRGWKQHADGSWRGNPLTLSWYLDTTLTFQYDGSISSRQQGPLTETMSCLGACWMMQRARYWEIEAQDERFGSWGQQGCELALKTWLSGGRMLTNHKTWFAHFFRTGNLGFPYEGGGHKERAMARSRELWLDNSWPKQTRPLSWLIEHFRVLRDWHTVENHPVLLAVNEAGIAFTRRRSASVASVPLSPSSVVSPTASKTEPMSVSGPSSEKMSVDTMSLSGIDRSDAVAPQDVFQLSDQFQVEGVTAPTSFTDDVVKLGNILTNPAGKRLDEPSIQQPMDVDVPTIVSEVSVPITQCSSPQPATAVGDSNLRKNASNVFQGKMNGEILLGSHDSVSITESRSGSESRVGRGSGPFIITGTILKSCLYYTCNSHDLTLEHAARNNLLRCRNGYELGCVSRERTEFADWNIVVDLPRSAATMHEQILQGLERARGEYVFLCESDVFYHPSHFDFTPPTKDTYYYNTNVWRVRYPDGHGVRTADCKQVSGICCNREFLLAHYCKRVTRIRKEGFSRKNGFEPGTRPLPWGYDNHNAATWESPYPNIDVTNHGRTLTKPKFSIDEFRNPKYADGWQETDDEIPGWGKLSGQLLEWLQKLANG